MCYGIVNGSFKTPFTSLRHRCHWKGNLAKDWGAHMLRCRWKEILAKAVTETQERNPSQVTKMCPINKIDNSTICLH